MVLLNQKKILDFRLESKSSDEIEDAERKKKGVLSQMGLFEQPKDIELLPFRMVLNFTCHNQNCSGHNMSILDWEFGQLYRKVKGSVDWKQKIMDKVLNVCSSKKDPYLILGNIARWQNIFCILGIFYPPKDRQLKLF